jgi:hypothetical protein
VIKDVCGNTLSPTGPITGGTYADGLGTVTYTYNYVDCSGLMFAWTYTYTVLDDTYPDFTSCPSNIAGQVPNASMCKSSVPLVNPVIVENCIYTLTWAMTGATSATGTGNIPSPYLFNVGETTITYTAADAALNATQCTFTVTVVNNLTATITGGGITTVNAPTTVNVTFTGSGGATPYMFGYQISVNGGSFGATQTITTPGASSTVSIPHPNNMQGVFVYRIVSVTDANGCNGTLPVPPANEVTVTVNPAADLSPTIAEPFNGNFLTTDPLREGYVQFTNGGTGPTNSAITFRISKIANFTISIPPLMMNAGLFNSPVQNTEWDIVEGLFFYTITPKVGTPAIPAGGNVKIGFTLTPTGPAGSTGNLTATIINASGGDNNNNNNASVRTFVIN